MTPILPEEIPFREIQRVKKSIFSEKPVIPRPFRAVGIRFLGATDCRVAALLAKTGFFGSLLPPEGTTFRGILVFDISLPHRYNKRKNKGAIYHASSP